MSTKLIGAFHTPAQLSDKFFFLQNPRKVGGATYTNVRLIVREIWHYYFQEISRNSAQDASAYTAASVPGAIVC